MKKIAILVCALVFNINCNKALLVDVQISKMDEEILKKDLKTFYVYLIPDIQSALKRIVSNKKNVTSDEFVSLSQLSDFDIHVAQAKNTVFLIEQFLTANSNNLEGDFNELKEYSNSIKEGEFRILYNEEDDEDLLKDEDENRNITRKHKKKKVKIYKKNVKFKKFVNINGDTTAESLIVNKLLIDGSKIGKLNIHSNTPNTELEYGTFTASTTGGFANTIVFQTPFQTIPGVIMNVNNNPVETVSTTSFTVITGTDVNAGQTYGWLAVGKFSLPECAGCNAGK